MKKAMTLCVAAVLTISASATAYAAPPQTPSCLSHTICSQELIWQLLAQRLEECLPGFQQLLQGCVGNPSPNTPETQAPVSKPDVEAPVDKTDVEAPADKTDAETPVDKTDTEAPADKTETADMSAYAVRVVELVNVERAKVGLSALRIDAAATQAAQVRAGEIRVTFGHSRPNGKSCFTALTEANVSFRTAGENIAAGQKTPEEVVTAWMNSEGHRKNILGSQYSAIGVGYLEGGYWTQFFIG